MISQAQKVRVALMKIRGKRRRELLPSETQESDDGERAGDSDQ